MANFSWTPNIDTEVGSINGIVKLDGSGIATNVTDGDITANLFQNTATDLGDADININLSNSHVGRATNVTTITANFFSATECDFNGTTDMAFTINSDHGVGEYFIQVDTLGLTQNYQIDATYLGNVDDAVTKRHTQNTDTGTTATGFSVDSGSILGKIRLSSTHGAADKTMTLTNTALTDDRTITFQNASGTVAFTSQTHTQNTDTGTTNASFDINSGGNDLSITTAGMSTPRAVDGEGLYNAVSYIRTVTPVAGNINLDSTYVGKLLVNSTTAELTLPFVSGVATGSEFTFIVGNATYLKVNCQTGQTASYLGTGTASGGYFRSNSYGSKLTLRKLTAASEWMITDLDGTWTYDA
jgi:hypothetical protein